MLQYVPKRLNYIFAIFAWTQRAPTAHDFQIYYNEMCLKVR